MSDSGDISPAAKRQRISYSPASPISQPSKLLDDVKTTLFNPQTPSSPQLALSGSHADVPTSTLQFYAFTPPASAPMSAEPSQQTPRIHQHSFQPGQTSVDFASLPQENFDTESVVPIAKNHSTLYTPPIDPVSQSEDIYDSVDPRRSDHDRETLDSSTSGLLNATDIIVNDSLLFKSPQSTYTVVQPRFSENLFEIYGLSEIASGVARYNLRTGVKNPLRKSYQNFISDISGKNKAISKPREFMDLLFYADDDWHAQKTIGKQINAGLSEDVLAKLDMAVVMESGKLPKGDHDSWRNVLDLDDQPIKMNTIQPGIVTKPGVTKPSKLQTTVTSPVNGPPRLSRRGTKRRYNDDAFEGYGEGYLDDAGDSPGADQDDDENRGSAKKKRRRVRANSR